MDISHFTGLLDRRRILKEEISALSDEATDIDNLIKAELGEETDGIIDGIRKVHFTRDTQQRVDIARLREEAPDVVAEYTKTVSFRRLLVED